MTPAPAGEATEFDASASTVAHGTIASYEWDFGDGSPTEHTTDPMTSHVYADAGSYTATVTETSSAGTSTTQVFTGHTMSRNGGPSAVAQETFEVVPTGTYRISGTFLDGDGYRPGPTATVAVCEGAEEFPFGCELVNVNPDGTYQAYAAGDVTVRAFGSAGAGLVGARPADDFTCTSSDGNCVKFFPDLTQAEEDVDFRMDSRIQGVATNPEGQGVDGVQVSMSSGPTPGASLNAPEGPTAPNNYQTDWIGPGTYNLRFVAPPGSGLAKHVLVTVPADAPGRDRDRHLPGAASNRWPRSRARSSVRTTRCCPTRSW